MTTSCRDFRTLLELVLEGRAVERALSELAWHEHLLSCDACRNLLAAEEALEILLATLPEPKLPAHLARRVVSRLRAAQKESRLDALLDLDRAARAPDRLAASVLARLQPERERSAENAGASAESQFDRVDRRLDRLLDRDRVIAAPEGLAERVLSRLHAERKLAGRATELANEPTASAHTNSSSTRELVMREKVAREPGVRELAVRDLRDEHRTNRFRSRWMYAAAAGLLATLAGWALWQRALETVHENAHNVAQANPSPSSRDASMNDDARSNTTGDKFARAGGERTVLGDADKAAQRDASAVPEAGMLAALDVLEHWDLLKSDDVDVLLSSSIDAADEVLLEYQDTEPAAPPAKDKEAEPHSKG
jgi:hypothetical protein